MDPLLLAAPSARWLVRIAESGRSGLCTLRTASQRARICFHEGRVREVTGVPVDTLGDFLVRCGALDLQRHRAVLIEEPGRALGEEGEVGVWLVKRGLCDPDAVRWALWQQRRAQLTRLLGWQHPIRTFEPLVAPSTRGGVCNLSEVEHGLGPLLWAALRELVTSGSILDLQSWAGGGEQRLTATGRWLCEALMAPVTNCDGSPEPASRLSGGALAAALNKGGRGSWSSPDHTAQVARAILRCLRAVEPERELDGSYGKLLRARRRLRAGGDARGVLGLSPDADPSQARRALRRLARHLHPDRFEHECPTLRSISQEVMGELAAAEERIRRRGRNDGSGQF